MELERLSAADLIFLAPEISLVIAAVILSLLDMLLPKRADRRWIGLLTLVSIGVAFIFVMYHLLQTWNLGEATVLLQQSYRVDNFANILKIFMLIGTALVILMSIGSVRRESISDEGEYYYLYLPALVGAMIMASSADLITLFVGIELLSITSYIMVGIRKRNAASNEGAMKYLIIGGVSSAVLLYGFSFLYGMAGSTNIGNIALALQANTTQYAPLIYVAFFLIIVGLGTKIAIAPFHAWAADVYQGSAIPVAAFLAVIAKGAAFAVLFRIILNVFHSLGAENMPITDDVIFTLALLAVAGMIVGTLLALKQQNMLRLLAYSGIANSGYLLVPIASHFNVFHLNFFEEFIFYLIAYMLMTIGAFAVLLWASNVNGKTDIDTFSGFYYRAPWTAIAMVVLLMSLAGVPLTAGFFGKFMILHGTLISDQYWLAGTLIVTSIVSFYFYFRIARIMFMRTHEPDVPLPRNRTLAATIWICVIFTLILGVYPQPLIQAIQEVYTLTYDLLVYL